MEIALAALCLSPLLLLPLTRDSGLFACAGRAVCDGRQLYRDVADQKGPAVGLTYAAAEWLFGATPVGCRGYFALVALVGSQLAAALGERLSGRAARLPCALCFALAALRGDAAAAWMTAQPDDLIGVLTLAACVALCRGADGRGAWDGVAGGLLGVACLLKPTALMPMAALGVALLLDARGGRRAIGRLLRFGVGGVVPVAAGAWHLLHGGVLRDCWQLVWEFNRAAYVPSGWAWRLYQSLGIADAGTRGLLLLSVLWMALGRRRDRGAAKYVGLALLGSWLAVIWQGQFFAYHWTPVSACLAVFAGCAISAACERLVARGAAPRIVRVRPVAVAIALAWLAAPADPMGVAELARRGLTVALGRTTLAEFQSSIRVGATRAGAVAAAAEHIREHSRASDGLVILGHESELQFLAGRDSPSRFINDGYLYLPSPMRGAWRAEFLAALRRWPPAYVVVVHGDSTPFEPQDSWTQLQSFGELRDWLAAGYHAERRFDALELFARQPDPTAAAVHLRQ
ncbi:MAG: hypothetical protein U1A27_12360 [Phycisphaerae bacterium]